MSLTTTARFGRTLASSRCSIRGRGFTLIEMVVVIGIIVVLAAIILGVARSVTEKSEVDQTRNVLNLMDLAMVEWETASDRSLSWGLNNTPAGMQYEVQSTDDATIQTSAAIAKMRASTGSREILAKVNDKLLVRLEPPAPTAPRVFVRDPWDHEIVMIHPGRLHDRINDPASIIRDVDGTIRTTYSMTSPSINACELRHGACINRRICFVSAGVDGEFGDLHLDVGAGSLTAAQQKDIELAADNIYSYALNQERSP